MHMYCIGKYTKSKQQASESYGYQKQHDRCKIQTDLIVLSNSPSSVIMVTLQNLASSLAMESHPSIFSH